VLVWIAIGWLACILAFLALAAIAPIFEDDDNDGQ
jgi:hypothetical protein